MATGENLKPDIWRFEKCYRSWKTLDLQLNHSRQKMGPFYQLILDNPTLNRDSQADRQTDGRTDRQRHRETDRERQRQGVRDRETHRQRVRQWDIQRQKDRQRQRQNERTRTRTGRKTRMKTRTKTELIKLIMRERPKSELIYRGGGGGGGGGGGINYDITSEQSAESRDRIMITSQHEKSFRITGYCEGSPPVIDRFSSQRTSDNELWCSLLC